VEEKKPIRCPNWSNEKDLRPGEEVLLGCGSTNIEGPDKEGLYDCLDCGIWFLPEEEPEEEVK
jgi:hypothetical protein